MQRLSQTTEQTVGSGIVTPRSQPYFRRPVMLIGVAILLLFALMSAFINSSQYRLSGIATTAESNTGTGKTIQVAGSQQNPVSVGVPFVVSQGQLRLNSFQRDMSSTVLGMNRFNRSPDRGQEWVLLNLTLYCDLPQDQSCDTSALDFEMRDATTTYNDNFVIVLDDEFTGTIVSGDELTGNLGFIISTAEAAPLLVVIDGGHPYYFRPVPNKLKGLKLRH